MLKVLKGMASSPKIPSRTRAENHAVSGEAAFWKPLALAAARPDPAEALDRALAIIGPLYRADRAWLGRYNAALTHFWGASQWLRPGVTSHFQEMQGVSVDVITDAHRHFLQGETVTIPDVERLPRQSRSLQAELRREGVRSTFAAPLKHGKKLIGFFGFDYMQEPAAWTPQDRERLRALALFLSALLHRSLAVSAPHPDLTATPSASIFVTEKNGLRALALDEVVFLEAEGDYSRVHMRDGQCYFERRSLRTWIAQLPRERFLRVHQRYLVNGASIVRLERLARWTLHLQDTPHPIPVGRAFRHALRLHMAF